MTITQPNSTSRKPDPGVLAMYAGLVLSVVATIVPYVDRATSQTLTAHVRAGYPSYSPERVDSTVTVWLAILSVVGLLGIASWVATIWAVRARRRMARWAATAMFALGTTVGLALLLSKEPTGQLALPPLLGWVALLPCLAGAVAVIQLWRRSSHALNSA
jgi:hypothetical protein